MELVRHDKSVLVKDLCVQFGVTSETIRKDLTLLEQEGHLIKTYGGAYIQDGVKNEIDVSIRKMLLPEIKDAIGQRCASLVEEGDTVFLDESTTCLAVARHLRIGTSQWSPTPWISPKSFPTAARESCCSPAGSWIGKTAVL